MGTNITGIGNANAIGFKSRVTGGIYFPPELKDALVGVWSAYGKSNDSTDRNIIKNKIKDRGGDFVISNAAFKLNSGFGEYKEDFTSWRIYPNIKVTDNVITTNGNFNSTWFIYKHSSVSKINEMNIKVSGIPKGGKILYFYVSDETDNLPIAYTIPKDGIYHLPESKINNNRVSVGFTVESCYDWNNIRIEQIPSFEGAFVTDGINDLITSTKTVQEMGITDEITVVSMIHKISSDNNWTNLIGELKGDHTFVANRGINTDKTGIYGYTYNYNKNAIVINNILGDKNDYIVRTSTSSGLDNKYYVTGFTSAGIIQNISQIAWYWTFIANRVLTTDEINQVIAYYNLDRTLRPDILCNIIKQGITNDNHADFNDKLVDYSGNGRDLQLFNIGWKGESGVGRYTEEFKDDHWFIQFLQTGVIKDGNSIKVVGKLSNIYLLYHIREVSTNAFKVKITGIKDKIRYSYILSGKEYNVYFSVDGIYDIPASESIEGNKFSCGFYINNASVALDWIGLTIEIIPSNKGALCLDGINDFGKVINMPIYKDYTIIIDYIRTKININTESSSDACVLSKSKSQSVGAFMFNLISGNREDVSYSFGHRNIVNIDDTIRAIYYQSKYINNGQNIDIESTFVDSDKLWLGTFRDNDSRFLNGAIYFLMSFPYSMNKFLIERQLKKYKAGTLYKDMVEFRPVIKSNIDIKNIVYLDKDSNVVKVGDYVSIGSNIKTSITVLDG